MIDLTEQSAVVQILFRIFERFEDPPHAHHRIHWQLFTDGSRRITRCTGYGSLPTQAAKEAGLVEMGEDFRINLHDKVAAGTELYYVYGLLDDVEYFIGHWL